jgi:sulfotransferase family protein
MIWIRLSRFDKAYLGRNANIVNMNTKNSLFYLVGFQRSGTTLLCHLLDKHPEIVCAEEPEISKRLVYKQYDLLRDAGYDSIKKSLDFYSTPPDRYTELVDSYLRGNIDEDIFLKSSYELFNVDKAPWVGAKEAIDLTAAQYDYFRKLIQFHRYELKIVFIERDIKGVINSFIKLGFFPPGKKRISTFFLKRFAKKYVNTLNDLDKHLCKLSTHFLAYEDLIETPREELRKIYGFLEADISETILDMILNTESRGIRNHYRGIKKDLGTGWQKNLSAKQISWLDKMYKKKRNPRNYVGN